jgi:CRISPR/Cas system-associated protein Cas10 (large subunit of type III CRISPR-Cas system)
LNKLWKSFKKPDIILYYHNQLKAKENLNLYGFKGNLGGFIDPKEHTLEDGIRDFLDINECEDYLILTNQEITIDPERTITTERLTWKR